MSWLLKVLPSRARQARMSEGHSTSLAGSASSGMNRVSSASGEDQTSSGGVGASQVTVYWRPGCPFCSRLLRGLKRNGISFREVDIWADADAAAFVRSVARGNETVPTVLVGERALVNPSVTEVAALLDLPT